MFLNVNTLSMLGVISCQMTIGDAVANDKFCNTIWRDVNRFDQLFFVTELFKSVVGNIDQLESNGGCKGLHDIIIAVLCRIELQII